MGNLATPFLVFFSFLDSTINGHVTQISDFLRYRKIKVTNFSEAAEFWKVLINFHKVMIIIRFYANYLKPCLDMLEISPPHSSVPLASFTRGASCWRLPRPICAKLSCLSATILPIQGNPVKVLLVESETLGFGIRDTAHGI